MKNPDYGAGARLLHRLVLGPRFLRRALLDLDASMFTGERAEGGHHVFVAGLARAGTTVLMRALYGSGQFRSLSYRDMPFVLAPNLWKRLSGSSHKTMEATERAHGDGVKVDFDSPEAFEEVFWRTICAEQYLFEDHLTPHDCDEEDLETFRTFVAQVIASDSGTGHSRYLSKNNNNLLRLALLKQALPNAVLLIPYRDPMQHALSLLGQHSRFSDTERNDAFTFDYMTWLGHHEFGATHRPFVFEPPQQARAAAGDPDSLDYWVERWCDAYEHALATAPDDALFVSYERLCDGDGAELDRVLDKVGLTRDDLPNDVDFRLSPRKDHAELPEPLQARADAIHRRLLERNALDPSAQKSE